MCSTKFGKCHSGSKPYKDDAKYTTCMVPFVFIKKGAPYQYCEDSILHFSFLSSLSVASWMWKTVCEWYMARLVGMNADPERHVMMRLGSVLTIKIYVDHHFRSNSEHIGCIWSITERQEHSHWSPNSCFSAPILKLQLRIYMICNF